MLTGECRQNCSLFAFQQADVHQFRMAYPFDSRFLALPEHRTLRHVQLQEGQQERLQRLCSRIWPEQDQEQILSQVRSLVLKAQQRQPEEAARRAQSSWTEGQIVLICYGDHIRSRHPALSPLQALAKFCDASFPEEAFSQLTLHLLPIYESPYKDGGFDIADPFAVNPAMGTWDDVQTLSEHFHVAVDFVANHLSIASDWFQRYLHDDPLYRDFFIGFDDQAAVQRMERDVLPYIYRPRPHNPFIPVTRPDGSTRWVYMTFSDHQPDVNYQNPFVFLKMAEVLLFYILHGVTMVRLDAIPYLWKEWGTACAHHPTTHALVELFRLISDLVNPSVKLLAESMEPLADSGRYLSTEAAAKAHLAYNFVPCGLIPHTLLQEDASIFQQHLQEFLPPRKGVNWAVVCGVTHDGSSINPCRAPKSVEGAAILEEDQINAIADYYTTHGRQELTRRQALASEEPHHLRADYLERFAETYHEEPRFVNYKTTTDEQGQPRQIVYEAISTYASLFDQRPEKIVAALGMALALPSIPFIYLTSFLAASNDFAYYLETGNPRELNRGRVLLEDLLQALDMPHTLPARVFSAYKQLLLHRVAHPAFHPDAPLVPVPTKNPALLSFLRSSPDATRHLLILQNVSATSQTVEIECSEALPVSITHCRELLSDASFELNGTLLPLRIPPYGIFWLECCP